MINKKKHAATTLLMLIALLWAGESQALKVTFGTKCHPDGSGSCVGERGICLIIEIKKVSDDMLRLDPRTYLGGDMAVGELTVSSADEITLEVLDQVSDAAMRPDFILEGPLTLNEEVCQALGFQRIQLQPGTYPVDYSQQRLGTIRLKMMAQ